MDDVAQKIVETAIETRRSHPDMPALEVLDVAMRGEHHTDPDFGAADEAFSDWLFPPSSFAELLRDAFAPSLSNDDMAKLSDLQAAPPALNRQWQEKVLPAFEKRYGIWQN
ncbi:MAG TPA: hypothetical protein VE029_12530 [Rhizobacter sp.]|nr:hypothetical protein [Rhizobacter sp.]